MAEITSYLMVVPMSGEVLYQGPDPVRLCVRLNDGDVHVLDQHLAFASLPVLPQETGNVEKKGLEK